MTSTAIETDSFVTLTYSIHDERGEVVGGTPEGETTTYVHGYAQLVYGLEQRLSGLRPGDKRSFTIDADEAFGERDEEAVFSIDRAELGGAEGVNVGDVIELEDAEGESMIFRVQEIQPDAIIVDMNHPLAGQRIRFEVEIGGVRRATDDEIAEAQADLEDRATDDEDDACGCGHDHEHGEHDHQHEHGEHDHQHEHGDQGLIQLTPKKKLIN